MQKISQNAREEIHYCKLFYDDVAFLTPRRTSSAAFWGPASAFSLFPRASFATPGAFHATPVVPAPPTVITLTSRIFGSRVPATPNFTSSASFASKKTDRSAF